MKPLSLITTISPPKKCACGIEWNALPPNHRHHSEGPDDALAGTWFECTCKSTLFISDLTSEERAEIFRNKRKEAI